MGDCRVARDDQVQVLHHRRRIDKHPVGIQARQLLNGEAGRGDLFLAVALLEADSV